MTNNVAIASVLGGADGISLHILGGIFLHRQATLFGDRAVESLARWSFDAAFLGGEGMDPTGIFNSHAEVVRLQRVALEKADTAFFCLDATKIGRSTPHRVASWPEVPHLVTDATPAQLSAAEIPSLKRTLIPA